MGLRQVTLAMTNIDLAEDAEYCNKISEKSFQRSQLYLYMHRVILGETDYNRAWTLAQHNQLLNDFRVHGICIKLATRSLTGCQYELQRLLQEKMTAEQWSPQQLANYYELTLSEITVATTCLHKKHRDQSIPTSDIDLLKYAECRKLIRELSLEISRLQIYLHRQIRHEEDYKKRWTNSQRQQLLNDFRQHGICIKLPGRSITGCKNELERLLKKEMTVNNISPQQLAQGYNKTPAQITVATSCLHSKI